MGLKITTGNYLKSSELTEEGETFVIEKVLEEPLTNKDGTPGEEKFILYLEDSKPLVLNKTNINRVVAAFGSNDADDWVGKSIIAYCDPTIEFGSEIVGGIRLRAVPKSASKGKKKNTKAKKKKNGAEDDEIPF
jgi:hypothetical protein|tara:strand:- start:203 stop:604 length:402 start_codon:yes stop_codon:yes gene_type:complete